MRTFIPLFIIGLLIVCLTVNAQIPQKISYQGMLTLPTGTPVQDGSYSFQFKIYPNSSGGSPLWTETQVGIPVGRGVFNVSLGSVTPLNISFSAPLFLEVMAIGGPGISGPITMSPRTEFTPSPYAFRADTANYAIVTVPTGTAGGDLTGSFPNPTVAESKITSGKILDSTIQRVDVKKDFKSPYADTADYAIGAKPAGAAGGDLTGTYPNPSITVNAIDSSKLAQSSVTTTKIKDSTIQRVDVASTFKAPFADTADYAKTVLPGGIAGGDLVGSFPNPLVKDSTITSLKILDGTILRVDVVPNFKAPYSDTADYAIGAKPEGVAGGDLVGSFPNPVVKDSAITSLKLKDSTIQRVDVTTNFKAPYADTADYARVLTDTGSFLPITGGAMRGPITSISDQPITMGKGNFGSGNINSGEYSFVAGRNNEALGYFSVIGGGQNNKTTGYNSTISGGSANLANGFICAIGGGQNNQAYGSGSTISGGWTNAAGERSFVGGGYNNIASGLSSVVCGGGSAIGNFSTGQYSAIVGGRGNIASGDLGSFIGGGVYNRARGYASVVSGGGGSENEADSNSALGHYSSIGGGLRNLAGDSAAVVSGGIKNHSFGKFSLISGGSNNNIDNYSSSSCIVGGSFNVIQTIDINPLFGAYNSTIGGGFSNYIEQSYSTINGGSSNRISSFLSSVAPSNSTIGGGRNNIIIGGSATISGGTSNTAGTTGPQSSVSSGMVVGGGSGNKAYSQYSAIGGGLNNTISVINYGSPSGSYGTIAGGSNNTIHGNYSVIPGGFQNLADGSYSFAAGQQAKANHDGSFVWADNSTADFSSERDNQFRVRANGGARFDVNNSGWVNLWDDGTNLINTSTNARLTLAGVWQSVSDRNQKENIIEINSKEILKKLMQLPVSMWNYKVEGDKIKHIGPMAQDFYSVFGVGSDDKTISSIDPAGVAFAAIQELSKQNEELKKQNEELNTRLGELEKLVKSIADKNIQSDKSIGELR